MFRLHLHTCNLGTQVRETRNPFTGETIVYPIDSGLTPAERESARSLLAEAGASAPDPDMYSHVVLSDGSSVNIGVDNLYTDDPCIALALEYYTLNPAVASFVHSLASRGNMAIISTTNPKIVALPLIGQRDRVLSRWPETRVVISHAELEDWLHENIR
jgi:hypothetical protein